MTEEQMRQVMVRTISLALDKLEDLEVAVLYQAVLFGNDNPTTVLGYDKVDYLFKNGMHEETKNAFLRAAEYRINQPGFGGK